MSDFKYYIFNKPYGVLSQFNKEVAEHITLKNYLHLPKDIYPIGRLDKDSEGLLLLTNDNSLKDRLLSPKFKSEKVYSVQVEGSISTEALKQLSQGVNIKLKKGIYRTLPCFVSIIDDPRFPDRTPPIRERKNIPTSWIEITIKEGKNRQVRKMCASVGFPCLRLIRTKIKGMSFSDVKIGSSRALDLLEIKKLKN